MVEVAKALLFGKTMGTLLWDVSHGRAVFEYEESFEKSNLEPSPLQMPVRSGVSYSFGRLDYETYKGLPGLFADSLPDTYGRALFEQWLSLIGRTTANPVETLCFMGKRCMGAIEYEPAVEIKYESASSFAIDKLVEVAQLAVNEKQSFATNLKEDAKCAIADILRIGTSAGGQRAKAIIAYNPITGEVRSGQIDAPDGFGYYIIKLDGVSGNAGLKETNNHGRIEYSFYLLAKNCGIDMTCCDLIEENGRAHFITERFDRIRNGKIHMQTLCCLAHYDYRQLRAYSYEQNFEVMRRLHLPYSDAQKMFARMVFNVVIRNQDDHTKNISYLMNDQGHWALSPAYDMGYAYNPKGGWTSQHQMSVNGKFTDITKEDMLECGRKNNIRNAHEIIDMIVENASHWPNLARQCGVPNDIVNRMFQHFELQ